MSLLRRNHLERSLLLLVLLVAFGLRMAYLDASSLWSDEGNTWALIQRDFGQIAIDAAADIHPPGYYWLLKGWAKLAGTSAFAMRFLSTWLGVLLVALIYRIGLLISNHRHVDVMSTVGWFGLLAGLVAAMNPFLIYYSQEARMYMLLALAGAMLYYGLLRLIQIEQRSAVDDRSSVLGASFLIVGAGILGLWAHYSFPILLAGAAMAYFIHWFGLKLKGWSVTALLRFASLYLIIGLAYLPWAETAIRQVLAWPKGGIDISLGQGAQLTLQTLLFGPLRNVEEPSWIWLTVAGILPTLGTVGLWRAASKSRTQGLAIGLILWLAAPIGMMFGLGLFTDSFLKFLLTASPAWCLLVAAVPWLIVSSGKLSYSPAIHVSAIGMGLAVAVFAGAAAYGSIPSYYSNPAARDNYAGVADYIRYDQLASSAQSEVGDAVVILNAPGQQDVWGYYDPGVPVLALPKERPANREATIAQLEDLDALSTVYGVFWATDESDPEGIVEGWLNQNGFEELDVAQGNVRFVTYAFADQLSCESFEPPLLFGEAPQDAAIQLGKICRSSASQTVSGDVVLFALHWVALKPIDQRLKVTLQLLDSRNQVIAQRDSEPAGGSRPTIDWVPSNTEKADVSTAVNDPDVDGPDVDGPVVVDQHGLLVPAGTPPGSYRLIIALYDAASGQRYFVGDSDFAYLGDINIERPLAPPPLALLPIQHRHEVDFGSVTLLGYDLHVRGFSHEPLRPVQEGDLVHVTLYWQASPELSSSLPADMQLKLLLGNEDLSGPLAGGSYPMSEWQAGDIIRGEFDIPFDGTERRLFLQVGERKTLLGNLP